LIHTSEIEKNPDEKIGEIFTIGDEVTSRIININTVERKIDLSTKTMIG
jgi:predicted RNA-binding protein with RPS1 domain